MNAVKLHIWIFLYYWCQSILFFCLQFHCCLTVIFFLLNYYCYYHY